jgi:hypothetical protein
MFGCGGRFVCWYSSKMVGTGRDPERAVRFIRGIEMDSYVQHLLENPHRWLNVRRTILGGPGNESCDLYPLFNGNGEILMPRNLPISVRVLVEENRTHQPGLSAENRLDQGPDPIGVSQPSDALDLSCNITYTGCG